jgi:aldose sugar dehydrogenase
MFGFTETGSPRRKPGAFMRGALMLLTLAVLTACADDKSSGNGGPSGPPPRGPLPEAFTELDEAWDVEAIATGLSTPVKLAQAPDGRLFVNLLGGTILVIEPDPPYTQHVFATELVLNGPEQGLLGIALSPDFENNSHVFVVACVDDLGHKQQIIRYTDQGNVGVGRTVIVDDLPVGFVSNGGALKFTLDGKLLLSIGDNADGANSQTDGVQAGRILRFNQDGSIPLDNPFYGTVDESEWVRGLRNSFGICVHPTAGTILSSENGPADNDKLNYISPGKNFEWGAVNPIPGAQAGVTLRLWPSVIVPTGLTYHSGNAAPPGTKDNLFLCSYDEEVIFRFVMDGSPPVNIFDEFVFARFKLMGQDNKPLDIIEGIDGSLYVSTFKDIWRIYAR